MPQLADYNTQKKYDMNDLDEDQKKEIEEIDKAICADRHYYIKNLDMTTRLCNMYFWRFTFYGVFAYLVHFVLMASVTNLYSQSEAHYCKGESGDTWSDQYDAVLTVMFIYHMIAWVRLVVFLVCTWLGTPLMGIYYALTLNCLLGLVTFIMVLAKVAGRDCESADDIHLLLILDIIYFVLFAVFTESMHVLPFWIINKRNNGHFVDMLKEQHLPNAAEDKDD